MGIPVLGVLPWLGAQGSRFRKVPALLYMWLTVMGPAILLLIYSKPIPMWWAMLCIYVSGHVISTIALQSSGATVSDPEYTKESGAIMQAVELMCGSVEQLKDLVKSVLDDKKK